MFPYVYKASDEDLSTHSSFCQGGGGEGQNKVCNKERVNF